MSDAKKKADLVAEFGPEFAYFATFPGSDEEKAEWLSCADPVRMIGLLEPAFADEVLSDRKIRLFVCACCRRLWHRLSAETRQNHVELAERYVDGQASREDFEKVEWGKAKASEPAIARCCRWDFDPYGGKYYYHYEIQEAFQQDKPDAREAAAQAALVRDIFRVPYPRRVTIRRAWQNRNVVGLAQTIYDERAFDQMRILADALEDAGCTDASILEHCRRSGEHVKGCWLIDLILGKE